ncbi:calcium/sodium antiporter [Estrella lausannensis]|uniref:CaCA family Na(+)/Ca(+) antiporter n=1 Tax=Estrella lausannensis TaxID=483423 RepID=A0A0H5DP66_9BACT|nr:calcium/sodium antiporter [Estrella lausannensis]CRX37713.1 CaCA family Na(+)/Ca(+) antiporter [Estrella lausannensis]
MTLLLGLIALIGGAELLVRAASRLAALLGVPPLIIGLTIVAIGTSSPELAISIKASLTNHPDLVIGNCLGSNICNILLILGIAAIIKPLIVTREVVWTEVPIMVGAHILVLALSLNGVITRLNSLFLVICCLCYILFVIVRGWSEREPRDEELMRYSSKKIRLPVEVSKQLGYFSAGLLFCLLGAEWMTNGAVALARDLGVSELMIGLTIVAFGTSLPELVTSLLASIRGQGEIGIGNIIGSCIFNILGIIGVSGVISPQGIAVAESALLFDLPVAIACSISCLPIFFTGHRISRWEGIIFLIYYVAYISYLILSAKAHHSLPLLSFVALWFLMPLTLLTFIVIIYREWRFPRI